MLVYRLGLCWFGLSLGLGWVQVGCRFQFRLGLEVCV